MAMAYGLWSSSDLMIMSCDMLECQKYNKQERKMKNTFGWTQVTWLHAIWVV